MQRSHYGRVIDLMLFGSCLCVTEPFRLHAYGNTICCESYIYGMWLTNIVRNSSDGLWNCFIHFRNKRETIRIILKLLKVFHNIMVRVPELLIYVQDLLKLFW
jgi:hypothetical protein